MSESLLQPTKPDSKRDQRWLRSPWFFGLLLVLAVVLVYSNSLQGAFIYDDQQDILRNASIRNLFPLRDLFMAKVGGEYFFFSRPLVNFTFALNYFIGQEGTFSYHVVNILVHAAAALALFGILRRTLSELSLPELEDGNALLGAFLLAMWWALHPLQTESVAYITQRYESIMGLFALLTLYCSIRAMHSPRSFLWPLAGGLACLLALASKEVAVAMPLLVLLYDRAFVAGSFQKAWRLRRPLYLWLLAVWGCFGYYQSRVFTRHFAGFGLDMPWWQYAYNQPRVILHYLRLVVWPHPLIFDYSWPAAKSVGQVLPGFLVVGGLFLCTLVALVRQPKVGFLGACFFLILAPTSSILPILDLVVEHRMYLPLAPALVLLAVVACQGARHLQAWRPVVIPFFRMIAMVIFAVVTATLATLTYLRNENYRSSLDLWQETVSQRPGSPKAHLALAAALQNAGYLKEAEQHFRTSISLAPGYPYAYTSLGILLSESGRYQEALGPLGEAARISPGDSKTWVNLGSNLLKLDQADKAEQCLRSALALDPKSSDVMNNLGLVYFKKENYQEAARCYQASSLLNPESWAPHWNLGLVALIEGQTADALKEFERFVSRSPDKAEALTKMGGVLYRQGQAPEATRAWEECLRLNPAHPSALMSLSWACATHPSSTVRDGSRSLQCAEALLKAEKVRTPATLAVLASALAENGRFPEAKVALQEALAMSKDQKEAWVQDLEKRLALFEQGRPYREVPKELFPVKPRVPTRPPALKQS